MIAKERMFLTKDKKKIVRAGDKDAAFLCVCAGRAIPKQYEHLFKKEMASPENKEKKVAKNKSGLTVNTRKDKK